MTVLRVLLALALLLSPACAAPAAPVIWEQDDLGDISLQEFTYSLGVDCGEAAISVIVMDENLTPVEGAGTYMMYVDYGEAVLGSPKTGPDGAVLYGLPGNTSYMRGLFMLMIEKKGFRGKEVHFDISPCYPDGKSRRPAPAQPAKAANSSTQNNTQNATANVQAAAQNASQAGTGKTQGAEPGTGNQAAGGGRPDAEDVAIPPPPPPPLICPFAGAIASLAAISLFYKFAYDSRP